MRINILTFQFAKNYGAILQAHALSSYIKNDLHEECEIIQYCPVNSDASWKMYKRGYDLRDILRNIYVFFNLKFKREFKEKNRIMQKAISELLPLTEQRYTRESILENPPIADAYICGSDQVWNFVKCFDDPTYFFDFTKSMKNIRKIGYAPSIADPWPKSRWEEFKGYLSNMDFISVREKSDVAVVEHLSGKPVAHVIDPVFLKTRKYWDSLSEDMNISTPYIFCYFLGTNDLAVNLVNKVKQLTGYKIVHLNLNARDRFNSDYNLRAVLPQQFIGLIKNAAYVCTNSFHCSAFSIIFRKNYLVAPKGFANARMESLQETFGLNNRMFVEEMIENMTPELMTVDYSRADAQFAPFKETSKQYLNNALYGEANKSGR